VGSFSRQRKSQYLNLALTYWGPLSAMFARIKAALAADLHAKR
jgi:hypothetical protein